MSRVLPFSLPLPRSHETCAVPHERRCCFTVCGIHRGLLYGAFGSRRGCIYHTAAHTLAGLQECGRSVPTRHASRTTAGGKNRHDHCFGTSHSVLGTTHGTRPCARFSASFLAPRAGCSRARQQKADTDAGLGTRESNTPHGSVTPTQWAVRCSSASIRSRACIAVDSTMCASVAFMFRRISTRSTVITEANSRLLGALRLVKQSRRGGLDTQATTTPIGVLHGGMDVD